MIVVCPQCHTPRELRHTVSPEILCQACCRLNEHRKRRILLVRELLKKTGSLITNIRQFVDKSIALKELDKELKSLESQFGELVDDLQLELVKENHVPLAKRTT